MLAIMLLLTAAPATTNVDVRHRAHGARSSHRARTPIVLTSAKLRAVDCVDGPRCDGTPAQSPYRLPFTETTEPSIKDMALAQDGTRCALIGQTICPHRTHKIVQIGDAAPKIPAR